MYVGLNMEFFFSDLKNPTSLYQRKTNKNIQQILKSHDLPGINS